jgi:hypothetical protein
MPAGVTLPAIEIAAFPPHLDLPSDYVANDWILWQKGKLIAARLRETPALVEVAMERLQNQGSGIFQGSEEWQVILQEKDVEDIAAILESPDHEGQRLRSSSPFVGKPFIEPQETETIRERAYLG